MCLAPLSCLVFLTFASSFVGCSTNLTPMDASAGNSGCTATLSGAVTFTNLACNTDIGPDVNGDGNGAVSVGFPSPPSDYQIAAGFTTFGGPKVGPTYSSAAGNATGVCEVFYRTDQIQQTWIASTDPSTPAQGSFSMNLRYLANPFPFPPDGQAVNFYGLSHGSVSCTLPALSTTSASGTATLMVEF